MSVTDDLLDWKSMFYLVADRVATDDPKLPVEVVYSYIQRACAELCRRSHSLRQRVSIDLQCGVPDYPVELDDCFMPVAILEATYMGCPLEPANPRYKDRGTEQGYHMEDGWVHLSCCPDADCCDGLELLISKAPTRKSCGIPEDYAEANAEAISAYVMWKVHSTRGLLYDPSLASKEHRLFRHYISEAEEDAETGSTNYHDYSRARNLYGKGRRKVR